VGVDGQPGVLSRQAAEIPQAGQKEKIRQIADKLPDWIFETEKFHDVPFLLLAAWSGGLPCRLRPFLLL